MSVTTCPRVIGATDDGRGIATCDKPMPCDEHELVAVVRMPKAQRP